MSYFNNINFEQSVKTIILETPEECLRQNSIIKELINQGHQILPTALFPNQIHIRYIEYSPYNEQNHEIYPKNTNLMVAGIDNSTFIFST